MLFSVGLTKCVWFIAKRPRAVFILFNFSMLGCRPVTPFAWPLDACKARTRLQAYLSLSQVRSLLYKLTERTRNSGLATQYLWRKWSSTW